MKNYKIISISLLLLFLNCKSFIYEKDFIVKFMDNDQVYYSLKTNSNEILIFDKDRDLTNVNKRFIKDNTTIKYVINKPITSDYYIVDKTIIDNQLALIILKNSEGKKNYVYHLIKKNNKWHIINVEINNSK